MMAENSIPSTWKRKNYHVVHPVSHRFNPEKEIVFSAQEEMEKRSELFAIESGKEGD